MENYYGKLCTIVYEALHPTPPIDELEFYLSFATPKMKILEPFCGSGRFLIPFIERGFSISGFDFSAEMIEELKRKSPNSDVWQCSSSEFFPCDQYDYIFIPSGSLSLLTEKSELIAFLEKIRESLNPNGIFVFALEGVGGVQPNCDIFKLEHEILLRDGHKIAFSSKYYYDKNTQIQHCPGLYQLYDESGTIIQEELMDFNIRLYEHGEINQELKSLGFNSITTYADFQKNSPIEKSESLIYICQ